MSGAATPQFMVNLLTSRQEEKQANGPDAAILLDPRHDWAQLEPISVSMESENA
jgi:hypothetical protein